MWDLKAMLQRLYNAKGPEIISPEERTRRALKLGMEVCLHHSCDPVIFVVYQAAFFRLWRCGRCACRILSRICIKSSAFSQGMPLAQLTPMQLSLGGEYALVRLSKFLSTSSSRSHSLTFSLEGVEGWNLWGPTADYHWACLHHQGSAVHRTSHIPGCQQVAVQGVAQLSPLFGHVHCCLCFPMPHWSLIVTPMKKG